MHICEQNIWTWESERSIQLKWGPWRFLHLQKVNPDGDIEVQNKSTSRLTDVMYSVFFGPVHMNPMPMGISYPIKVQLLLKFHSIDIQSPEPEMLERHKITFQKCNKQTWKHHMYCAGWMAANRHFPAWIEICISDWFREKSPTEKSPTGEKPYTFRSLWRNANFSVWYFLFKIVLVKLY